MTDDPEEPTHRASREHRTDHPDATERGMPCRIGIGAPRARGGVAPPSPAAGAAPCAGRASARGRIERRGDRDQQQDPADDEHAARPGVRHAARRTERPAGGDVPRGRATPRPGMPRRFPGRPRGWTPTVACRRGSTVLCGTMSSTVGDASRAGWCSRPPGISVTGVVGQGDQERDEGLVPRREVLLVGRHVAATLLDLPHDLVPAQSRAHVVEGRAATNGLAADRLAVPTLGELELELLGVGAASGPSRSRPASDRRSRLHADSGEDLPSRSGPRGW